MFRDIINCILDNFRCIVFAIDRNSEWNSGNCIIPESKHTQQCGQLCRCKFAAYRFYGGNGVFHQGVGNLPFFFLQWKRSQYQWIKQRSPEDDIDEVSILFQKEEDNSSLVLMNQNYYDVLATLYIKLGKNKEAKEAEAKYNEIEQAQKNELKKFFPQAEDEQ